MMANLSNFSLTIFVAFLMIAPTQQVLNWLDKGIEEVKEWTPEKCMDKDLPLTHRQRNYCKKYPQYMSFVSKSIPGIKRACMVAFTRQKWNCESIRKAPHFTEDIDGPSKQSAAVNAIASAYLLHNIISGCASKGLCPKCKERKEYIPIEARKARGDENLEEIVHQSGACDAMFPVPQEFTRRFLKVGKKRLEKLRFDDPSRRGQEEIDYHNKLVGFKIAYETRSPRCYCPGLFPICYTKVCYTAMDFFWKAAARIRELSQKARQVRITNRGALVPIYDHERPISKDELVYAVKFDVCSTNKGNKGRLCSIDKAMKDKLYHPYCTDLCCGKGKWEKRPSIRQWECECKFKWCCEVKCKTCSRNEFRYVCTA